MKEKDAISFRIDASKKKSLDVLATLMDRDRSFIINEAIAQYIELHEWQISHIQEGLEQANRSEFAGEKEVQALIKRYVT